MDVSINEVVGPVDGESVDEAMRFLEKLLAIIQQLDLGEENSVLFMLVDVILHAPCRQYCRIAHTMLVYTIKGMDCRVPLIKLVLMYYYFNLYLEMIFVAALYKAGDAIRVLKKRNVIK